MQKLLTLRGGLNPIKLLADIRRRYDRVLGKQAKLTREEKKIAGAAEELAPPPEGWVEGDRQSSCRLPSNAPERRHSRVAQAYRDRDPVPIDC